MKKIIFTILFSILLINCQKKPKTEIKHQKPYDESYIVVFDYHELGDYKDTAKVTLNRKEIQEVDLILNKVVKDYNTHPERHFFIGSHKPQDINLINYKRQYYPYINKKGEKEVEVNCFCGDRKNDNWKKGGGLPAGGGDCYFSVNINLSQQKFDNFFPNGPA
jgi:hypothetical protein